MSCASPASTPAGFAGATGLRPWFAVLAVAAGIFILVTAEMLPVGILTPVAADLGVSNGVAGLMVTVPGLVAALAAPLVTIVSGNADRRHVLVALIALLTVANAVSALASSFALLLAARVLVGVSIGGFWALAAGLAYRLVPPAAVGRAMSLIFGGIALASVIGVPMGTVAGDLVGWRGGFALLAGFSLVIAVALVMVLPSLPPALAVGPRAIFGQFANPLVRTGILAAALIVVGHFAGYTFVRPVLQEISGVEGGAIGALLLAYGVAGVAANFLAGSAAARAVRGTLVGITLLLGGSMLAMSLLGTGPVSGTALLLAWGLGYGGVSVSLQTWMLRAAPERREAVSALFASVFNISIALGALTGGRIVDAIGPAGVLWFGGALLLLASAVIIGSRAPTEVERRG